jgi:hypothetical protein
MRGLHLKSNHLLRRPDGFRETTVPDRGADLSLDQAYRREGAFCMNSIVTPSGPRT